MTARTIMDFIATTRERGHSIIFSTHYMTEAEMLCNRIALIHRGELLTTGTKEAIYAQTGADNLQAAFLSMVDERTEVST